MVFSVRVFFLGCVVGEVGPEGRADHAPSQLSGVEQQRVAIALALAKNPRIAMRDGRVAAPVAAENWAWARSRCSRPTPGRSSSRYASAANRGRTNSSNVSRSQLATTVGVSARIEAVRGMSIVSATSPK